MNAPHRPVPYDSFPRTDSLNERQAEMRPPALRTVSSRVLFNGANEIAIEHSGNFYRLKITRQNKLILNK